MGGFNPITTILGSVGGLLNKGNDIYNAAEQYKRAREVYDMQERDILADRDTQAKQQALETEQETTRRRNALKRTVANQEAAFGGQGIDAHDGSGQAVLLGLFKESDDERAYRARLDAIKRASLESDTATKRMRNLLSLQNNYSGVRNALVDLGN